MSLLNRMRQAWDRLTLYMPLLVMLHLALGSWWLVRSMPGLSSEPKSTVVRQEPDYQLRQFVVKIFDEQGRQVREVMGEEGRHFPVTGELHIQKVRFNAVNDAGQQLSATAENGIASDDGEQVTLLGDAHAVREANVSWPRIALRGEEIMAWIKEEKITSNLPVEITRSGDVFKANSMDFDVRSGHYQLSGRVLGYIAPAPPSPSKP